MPNILRIKRRLTGSSGAPTGLAAGELAHSFVDNKLYIGNGSQSIVIGGEGHFATNAQLSSEVSRAEAAEGVLDGKIATEKSRIDAILSASQADKDSFAEIVTLVNSIDTENDQAFAGYVTSNNAALAAEVSARQSADTTLQSNITAEASARAAADNTLQGNITSEANTRAAAITSVTNSLNSEISRAQAAETDLSNRITALETEIDGGSF